MVFVSSGPMSGSVLTAQSLEPALDSVSLSFSAHPWLELSFPQKPHLGFFKSLPKGACTLTTEWESA